MSIDVDEQLRQLVVAFDEFVEAVAVDEVTGGHDGPASAIESTEQSAPVVALDNGPPSRRFGLVAAAVLMVGGLVGALALIDRTESGPTDLPMPPADTEKAPVPMSSSPVSAEEDASPLIDMRSMLINQANRELFVVRSDAESYWRLATLARFDGTTWGFPESALSGPDGGLAADRDGAEDLRQEIRILDLGGRYVPAAADPIAASPGDGVRWNADSATLIKTDGDLVAGDAYEIVSVWPLIALEDLQSATSTSPGDPIYLELPDDVPAAIGALAREVTAETTTPYETALALQDWFRTEFDYSLEVQAGHSSDAMESFLRDRIGYAEQFAGTFAVMMRAVGIPARVAVGFTPGTDAGDLGAAVLGKHAHAWPEVWFDGIGWVPFEPTPGRGAPGAERHTNVVAQQSEES